MAILPMTLIITILVATGLDQRGYLGPSLRLISVGIPLAVIAASAALGLAALHFAKFGEAASQPGAIGPFSLAVGMFYLVWGQLHLTARATWTAVLGAVGTGVAIVGSLVVRTATAGSVGQSEFFVASAQVGLILLLVPAIAPALAAQLAKSEMPVQRAVVLGAFGAVVAAMFTTIALVGAV